MASSSDLANSPKAGKQANPDVAAAIEVIDGAKQISQEGFNEGLRRLLALTIDGYPKALRSTAARRNELLRKHEGDQEACLADVRAQAAAIVEETKTWILGLVPYVGLPAAILYPTWRALRRVCLLAGVYGHDLKSEMTKAKILHAFAGLRAVPATEFVLEAALQAVWVAFAGPATAFLPVGALASKLCNVEGHVMGIIGKETFEDGMQPVSKEVYVEVLDPEPTREDYIECAKQEAYGALRQAFYTAEEARQVLLDGKKRSEVIGNGQDAFKAALKSVDVAKDKAVVLAKGAVAVAPEAAAASPAAAKKGVNAALAWGRGLFSKKQTVRKEGSYV